MIDTRVILRATAVSRLYGEGASLITAVRSATFEIRSGEMVLIMGPSGGGKTTLLSMVGGLLDSSSGAIEIDGVLLQRRSQSELTEIRRRKIGFIFQSFRLLDALSITENVELPLTLDGVRRPASRDRATAFLDLMGLGHRRNVYPRTLSGGEKQRVAIARAFVNDPPLILADEPTGSLDSRAGQVAIELLHRAARERGKAVLVVSHDPRIRPFADRVLAMEDGVLRAEPER